MISPRRILVPLAKLAVSAALLWFVYRHTKIDHLADRFRMLDWHPIPLIAGLLLCNTLISSCKWRILLLADDINVPLKNLFSSYMVATFLNLFLPSSIGGDSYRIYDIARRSDRTASSLASVAADRLSGFIALVCISSAAGLFVAHTTHRADLAVIPIAALIAIAIGVYLLYHQKLVKIVLARLRIDRWPRVAAFITNLLESFSTHGKTSRVPAQIIGLSFLFQSSAVFCIYLMSLCLGMHLPFIYFCAFVPLISLLEAVPISIYGLGVRDAAYAFFFGTAGVSQVTSISLALLFVAISVSYSLVGGLFFFSRLIRGRLIRNHP